MTRLIIFLFILIPLIAQSQVKWLNHQELQEIDLQENQKKILFFFTADWCTYCQKMKAVTFNKTDIIDKIDNEFLAVKINLHTKDSIKLGNRFFINNNIGKSRRPVHDLAIQLSQRSEKDFNLPFLVILNPDLSIRTRVFNYLSPKNMLLFLKQ